MSTRPASAKLRAWSAGVGGAALLLAMTGCLNAEPFARFLAGGLWTPREASPPSQIPIGPPPTFSVIYRVGELWEASDGRIEIYDRRRWFWLDVRDPDGRPPQEAPAVAVRGPDHLTQPQVYEVQKDQSADRFFVRVRFYDPGSGYRLAVQNRKADGATERVTFELPEVLPAVRRAGAFNLTYRATPSLGRPSASAVLTVHAADAAGEAAVLPGPPRVRLVNPCGWGPIGTFSAVAGEAGAYAFEVPKDEVIDVTGNYKVKVYPLSDQASYVEYTYETR